MHSRLWALAVVLLCSASAFRSVVRSMAWRFLPCPSPSMPKTIFCSHCSSKANAPPRPVSGAKAMEIPRSQGKDLAPFSLVNLQISPACFTKATSVWLATALADNTPTAEVEFLVKSAFNARAVCAEGSFFNSKMSCCMRMQCKPVRTKC